MKKLKRTLGFCLVGASLLVSSQAHGNWCGLDGCWELGVEALYWKPCTCDWQYGFSTDPKQTVGNLHVFRNRALTVNADYDWGVRVLAEYIGCDCCSFMQLDWTYLQATDSQAAPTAFIRDTTSATANQQNVVAQQHIRYNRVNLRGAQYLHRGCNFELYTYAGIRWIDLDQRRRINSTAVTTNAPVSAREHSQFDGAGLEFGLGGEYRTRCGLSLLGHVAPTIALGRRKHSLCDGIGSRIISYPSRTHCSPGLDFRMGLGYTWECRCASIAGEIGYEMNYYINVLATIDNWIQPEDAGLQTRCENLGFGGPFASLKVRF